MFVPLYIAFEIDSVSSFKIMHFLPMDLRYSDIWLAYTVFPTDGFPQIIINGIKLKIGMKINLP